MLSAAEPMIPALSKPRNPGGTRPAWPGDGFSTGHFDRQLFLYSKKTFIKIVT
jgi:hypothetical protein